VRLFTRASLIRAARFTAYGAFALLASAVIAALVIPALVDTRIVEAELQEKLSKMLRGNITWEKLELRLLPTPRGTLNRVRVEIPEAARVGAEEVEVLLRLLPLLRGRAEIASLSLSKPVIELEFAPKPSAKRKPLEEARVDPVEAYRSIIEAISRFAPDAVLDVEDADLDVRVSGLPSIRVRRLEMHARTASAGIEVELTAESEYWSGLKLSAQVAYSDLSGRGSLRIAELRPQVWLDHFLEKSPVDVAVPAVALRAQARADGKENLECDFDIAAASVEIRRAAERLQVPEVALSGRVSAKRREILVHVNKAQLGASRLAGGSLRYALKDDSVAALADFDLDLAQAMDGARRLVPDEAGKALETIQPVSGRARGRAKLSSGRSGWSAVVEIRESNSSIGVHGAPGPVKLASASVEVGRDAVKIDRAALAMLDARVVASATLGYAKQFRIEGSVSEGSLGESFLAWIWKIANLPPHLALKTPVRIAVERAAWSPKRPLDVEATASFETGPSIAVALGWTPGTLDVRRAAVKDARSDAVVALLAKANQIEGKFSGSLYSASLASALKSAKLPSGGASGELRLSLDRRHPERFSAEGNLKGEAIDLEWLLGRSVMIESLDLQAGGGSLRIASAAVNWADQHLKLQGEIKRGAGGPVIDAQLDSPGVVVDALLAAPGKTGEGKAEAVEKAPWDESSKLWPLPVTGRIAMRSDFVQSGRYKVAPFAAALALEERRARLDLQKAQLCGISLPATVEATPEGIAMVANIAAQKQQLEATAHCLTERGVMMTGTFDLKADLRARGRLRDLARNLEGTIRAESRDGKVMKFALLGNILSMQNVAAMFKEGTPKIDDAGFPYRTISTSGRFSKGRFTIEEGVFTSSGVGLAATGWISLTDYQSRLSVLVAPFGRLDRIVRGVPVIGYVVGGAITSVPVGVSGDIRDPLVVPLGPTAITSELLGIFERTLKLPGKLVPLPGGEAPAESPSPP
jgi:hypothetical protein